jgi:predicted O-methyltransferase YrrM
MMFKLERSSVRWVKRGGTLEIPNKIPAAPRKQEIEATAKATNQLGAQKLAGEYGQPGATRTPNKVRSSSAAGDLYAWLVAHRTPKIVVEFGSAFGVSGMYFAAGLEGWLYSFEINHEWAAVAERNIGTVSDRFTLTRGAFEDNTGVVPGPIDLAFVDGIHSYDFVTHQYAVLKPLMSAGGLILFDDIDFRKPGARMWEAWLEIVADPDVAAAAEYQRRVGVVELRP